MRVLGIHDGTHNASAALVEDGRVVHACAEERFNRKKGAGGWPGASVAECLFEARGAPIELVAFSGFTTPSPLFRLIRPLQTRFSLDDGAFWPDTEDSLTHLREAVQFRGPLVRWTSGQLPVRGLARLLRVTLERELRTAGIHAPLEILDHHLCHAASTFYTSGARDALVIVADGVGDGLALTVWRGGQGLLERVAAMPYPHSYGLLYASFTGFLGFRPFRHEGKLTGLAARGDPDAVREPFPFEGPPDVRRTSWVPGVETRRIMESFRRYRREDLCAWLQRGIEQELCALIGSWMRRTGLVEVALAGGLFANVRLNQRIGALPGLERLFVHPDMGDGGLAVGAALAAWARREPQARPARFDHAFLGTSFSVQEMERAARDRGLQTSRPSDLADEVARRLASGQIVACFGGAMEYGPRALGNRSILASASDPQMSHRLNECLSRSEFMPFAPVLLARDAEDWVEGLDTVRDAAAFMTVSVQAKPAFSERCPAAVHVDGSLRPQLVDPQTQPFLARVLERWRELTGSPALINTSFNLHEEPIVRTPEEALRSFLAAHLDALALGPFLVCP